MNKYINFEIQIIFYRRKLNENNFIKISFGIGNLQLWKKLKNDYPLNSQHNLLIIQPNEWIKINVGMHDMTKRFNYQPSSFPFIAIDWNIYR